MLRANSRQFFNYKMKGRRARIRNQKRSVGYHRSLDKRLEAKQRQNDEFWFAIHDLFFGTHKRILIWMCIVVMLGSCQS